MSRLKLSPDSETGPISQHLRVDRLRNLISSPLYDPYSEEGVMANKCAGAKWGGMDSKYRSTVVRVWNRRIV
jgi:hypothetical protein